MSEIKRYGRVRHGIMAVRQEGEYVLYSDHAAAVARLEAVLRWTSVEDGLPDRITGVLVIDADGSLWTGYCNGTADDWDLDGVDAEDLAQYPVTHWMLLPPPPACRLAAAIKGENDG